MHPLEMRGRLQQVQLLLLRVPVRANALEAAGAVVERVGHEADPHVVVAPELAVVVDPRIRMFHRLSGSRGLRLHSHQSNGIEGRASTGGPASDINYA